jgi:FkbM family methyltransferase
VFTALWEECAHRIAAMTREIYSNIKTKIKVFLTMFFPSLDPHSYLTQVTGVIHVGANLGQERDLYAKYNLNVMWIEPVPEIFERLCKNIKYFPQQTAVNHLITDKDGVEYAFHVANNDGASSSILELAQHGEIWPEIHYVSEVTLKSITLDSLLKNIGGALPTYQALIMDTQGSELLVLKGATKSIGQFKYIRTEAADFESYMYCAKAEELTSYLAQFGFKLTRSDKFAESPKGGRYFDLLYRKS